jgi:hypothetical protein
MQGIVESKQKQALPELYVWTKAVRSEAIEYCCFSDVIIYIIDLLSKKKFQISQTNNKLIRK